MLYTLIHNPRCAKSREAKAFLEAHHIKFETFLYLEEGLTPAFLEALLEKLELEPLEVIRTKESVWQSQFAELELNEDELILSIVEEPVLLERPILYNADHAAIVRSEQALKSFLNLE